MLTKILFNPYFILRVISYILAVFIGVDLFNEKITFTESHQEKEELAPTNEKNIDKATETNNSSETKTKTETTTSKINDDITSEAIKQERNPLNYWNQNKDISYEERMLKMLESRMKHDKDVYKLFTEESQKGTADLLEEDQVVSTLVQNRIDDTKTMLDINKSLDKMKMEDTDSDNKRSLIEENEEGFVSKKFKDSDK
jgi:hypothetical protein